MSREKQIEEMAKISCINCDLGNCGECFQTRDPSECVIAKPIAESIMNAGYRKQEWISVEERLPDIDPHGKGRYGGQRSVRVLCACKQKGGKTFVKEGYYEPCGNGRVCWRIPGSIDAVTHWMPLPEPPKGE